MGARGGASVIKSVEYVGGVGRPGELTGRDVGEGDE